MDLVLGHLRATIDAASRIVRELAHRGLPDRSCGCDHALRAAIMTAPDKITQRDRDRLGIIAAQYLGSA